MTSSRDQILRRAAEAITHTRHGTAEAGGPKPTAALTAPHTGSETGGPSPAAETGGTQTATAEAAGAMAHAAESGEGHNREGGSGIGVARRYRVDDPEDIDRVELLAERLIDYKATVRRCGASELAATVALALAGSDAVVVPPGLPAGWLAAYKGKESEDLNAPGVTVLTGCAVAIAQTGTLILDAGPGQGRRALTLVPDHHVCVVFAEQVVVTVPAALRKLEDPRRPLTFVSGPSATSDIELNRVEGVHGPRRLEVILVTS